MSMCDIRNSSSKLYAWKIAHLDNNALVFYYVDAEHSVNICMMLKNCWHFSLILFSITFTRKNILSHKHICCGFPTEFLYIKNISKWKLKPEKARSLSLLISAILMKSVDTIYSLSLNAHIYARFLWIGHVLCGNMLPFCMPPHSLHHQNKMRSKLLIGIMNLSNIFFSQIWGRERKRVRGREWVKVPM